MVLVPGWARKLAFPGCSSRCFYPPAPQCGWTDHVFIFYHFIFLFYSYLFLKVFLLCLCIIFSFPSAVSTSCECGRFLRAPINCRYTTLHSLEWTPVNLCQSSLFTSTPLSAPMPSTAKVTMVGLFTVGRLASLS